MNGKPSAVLSEVERHKLINSPVDGQGLMLLFEAGLNWLTTNQQHVNSLNVFPVPDGDTGTNMSMTFKAAVQEIEGMTTTSIGEVSKVMAKGALMVAAELRGYSFPDLPRHCQGPGG